MHLVVQGSSCSTSPTSLSQDWKFYCVSSNNTKWEYEWTSTRRPVTNPVTGRRTSTEKTVTAWIAMRKGVTGKGFTLTSWKTDIAKCRRVRTTWTLCKRRTREAIPRATKFGSLRSVMNQNLSRPTWNHFLEFGINLWSWPWNYIESERRNTAVQKDLRLLNSGALNSGRNFCVTVAIDHSTVDGFHDELKLSSKNTKGKALRRISWVKEFYLVRWNDYHTISVF